MVKIMNVVLVRKKTEFLDKSFKTIDILPTL